MIVRLYSLFDRRMREFGAVMTAKNDEAILRGLEDQLKNSGGMIEKHPKDFDVYVVGEFDDESGEVARLAPKPIANIDVLLNPPAVNVPYVVKEA